ncbi:MAG: class A beta-lactamase-related serine hydrolase [Firmicutes bacterium]|nr:class A beta-lactamase-related serine hydrolase [Bacillota bacterium]
MYEKSLTLLYTICWGFLIIIATAIFLWSSGVTVLAASTFRVDNTTYLFNAVDGAVVGSIQPQTVTILESNGQWHLIQTWLGDMWIHEDYHEYIRQRNAAMLANHRTEMLAEIDQFMRPFYNQVSVHYENFESGFSFSNRGDYVYFAASAAKLAFALYIYDKTERGDASMGSTIRYTEADHWEGSGIIRHRYNFGQEFDQRELLHLMLVPSDNIATRLLRRMHGLNGYRDFIASIGGNTALIHNVTYGELTANEAGLILRNVHNYFNSGGTYSDEFRNNMLSNQYKFITSSHPVASKTGWAANFGQAYHDLALIQAPSPFGLAILSHFTGDPPDRRTFEEIASFFEEFNRRWFE